jgi:glycine cleavage system H protein
MTVRGFAFPDVWPGEIEQQVRARVHDDGRATVGITALGIRLAGGEFCRCRPRVVGTPVEAGRAIAAAAAMEWPLDICFTA